MFRRGPGSVSLWTFHPQALPVALTAGAAVATHRNVLAQQSVCLTPVDATQAAAAPGALSPGEARSAHEPPSQSPGKDHQEKDGHAAADQIQ